MADFGRVLAVNTGSVGDQLVGNQLVGFTVLQFDDASEFPTEGGTISTSLGLLGYISVDPDEDTMTLAAPLPATLLDEARVDLWDTDRGAVVTEKVAEVTLEGSEDDGDPFKATVPQHLRAYLPDGIRTGPGEIVEVDVESGMVVDVPGRTEQLDGQAVWNPHSYRTFGGQRVANATHQKLLGWPDVETDGLAFSGGQWRVIYPAWYQMSAWLTWAWNATGRRRVRIIVNGNIVRVMVAGADPDIETYLDVSHQMRLFEGDIVEVWAYQTSGAALSITAGAFSMHRLSI